MSRQAHRECDLVVIGCGPGGYTAALEASERGLDVLVVDKGPLGGTCLNWGCIPTKLLLGATSPLAEAATLSRLRLLAGELRTDLTLLQKRRHQIVAATQKAMASRLERHGIKRLEGVARFVAPGQVDIKEIGCRVFFKHCIIAAGSLPRPLPNLVPNGSTILDSTQCLALSEPPGHLAVIGGGAIGIELAQIFHRLGSTVTLIEALPRIAPTEDPEVSKTLHQILRRKGWSIHAGDTVQSAPSTASGVVLTLESGAVITADTVLVAAGRLPGCRDMDLSKAGISTTQSGWIETGAHLGCSESIYAVGDVNGRTLLAHAAEHQARYVVRHIVGEESAPYSAPPMPACIYGDPEVVRCGETEEVLRARGIPVSVSSAPLAANPIAQSHGAPHGMVKVVWENGRVRGITAVGHGVSHLVTAAEIITSQAWNREQAESLIFAHPTLDEALKEALLAEKHAVAG